LQQDEGVLMEVSESQAVLAALSQLLIDQRPDRPADAWRCQVHASWLVARLCDAPAAPAAATTLVAAGVVRPLVLMLGLGWESVQSGTGGALHYLPNRVTHGGEGGGEGGGGGSGTSRRTRRASQRIEPMDTNGHASAAAALLALARAVPGARAEIDREMIFQEAWCGRRVRLDAL
jgi:hypothetical protein